MAAVEVSVVVPVRDGEASLPALLASLAAQTLPRERFEVIVVDNASRDSSASVARDAGATVVSEPVPNRARARNAGVAASSAPLLAFIDADCVASPQWLDAFLACAERTPLVAGRVITTTAERPNSVERFERLWRFEQQHWVKLGWAATANLLVRRDAFDAVHGFDAAYPHTAEDADFCLRAGRAGYPLGYCAEAVAMHDAEHELVPMLKRAFFHGYGSSQAHRRIGVGQFAWRRPLPLVHRDAALREVGYSRGDFAPEEYRRMLRMARLAYGARIAGSLWAEARRAR
ncbi:MAG TPA: glycosyltransferase [Thermoleophilaceae bacterium]|jgi:GT2 family glycosyltransferase|nr:glycosyltransferase [Thermoleophilaceae bacterium]